MSMPGAWPEEVEAVTLSVEIESDTFEEENEEDCLSRIDLRGLYPRSFPIDFASKHNPTGRPLAEPPMFNYDDFERRFVPSRKRFQILFPERREVGKMTEYMDRHIESELLVSYIDWVRGFLMPDCWYEDDAIRPTKEQKAFYNALLGDLIEEEDAVRDEMLNIRARGYGSLERWEFEHLDNDLRTTHIERELAKNRDEIFQFGFEYAGENPEIRAKYQHLFPADADDVFRHWHQRTKRALREVEESSKIGKGVLYREVYANDGNDGIEFYVLQPAAYHKARAFGHGYFALHEKTYDELIRVYRNGRVLYPEYDSERGKDWLEYMPPKVDDESF